MPIAYAHDLRATVTSAAARLRALPAEAAARSPAPGKWSPKMENASEQARTKPRADHALDRLAWASIPADQLTTLEYFMRDYVAHLKHHLRQIDPALGE